MKFPIADCRLPIAKWVALAILIPGTSHLTPALAADRITATVTITNAPTTNAMTFVITTTAASTRTWTNSVIVPATQILTNSTVNGIATNLQLHLQANPPAGVSALMGGAAVVVLYGQAGVPLQLTGVGTYFSVSYATQSVSLAYTVRIPLDVESQSLKTNVASQLAAWLENAAGTNSINQNATSVSELLGTTNSQTVTGRKLFQNPLNRYHGIVSNAPSISGNTDRLTNGAYISPGLLDPVTTNLVNHGNAMISLGSGVNSEQYGDGATATGDGSSALGYLAAATDFDTTAIGAGSTASEDFATALGFGSLAQATNSTALGVNAAIDVTHTNSTAIGANSTTTAANQVMLGAPGISTTVQNNLNVQTNLLVGGGARITGAITNPVVAGQATWNANADIAFTRFAITSLATGNNAAVPVGTNTFVEVSGPGGAFTLNGIANGRDGKLLIIVNQTGFDMTVAHQSGTDPTAANRIITMTGADRATTANGAATLIYSGAASRWILISLDP